MVLRFEFDRRIFLLGSSATIGGLTNLGASAKAAASRFRAVRLRAAQLDSPMGLEFSHPHLSWQVEGSPSFQQSAYRIRVASSVAALRAGVANLWDSGIVRSANSVGVAYAGQTLQSRQRCHWDVTVWDQHGVTSAASALAWWEMGLLEPDDWQAKWIAAEDEVEREERENPGIWSGTPANPGERRTFRLPFECGAGEVRILAQSRGMIFNLSIDGVLLTSKPDTLMFNGVTPATRLTGSVTSGRHMLSMEVIGLKRPPIFAVQLRLPDGRWVRRGWQTRSDPPAAGWQKPDTPSDGWVAAEISGPQPPFALPPGPARLLRRTFTLPSVPKSARVYVSALGGCELFLNGQKIGDATLQPEQSDYRKHVPYRVHDVAGLLKAGENVLAAMVADGNYASYWMTSGHYSYGPPPRRILVQLETVDIAGRRTTICSDENWRSAPAPLIQSQLYYGEDWDFRLDQPGWAAKGFNAAT